MGTPGDSQASGGEPPATASSWPSTGPDRPPRWFEEGSGERKGPSTCPGDGHSWAPGASPRRGLRDPGPRPSPCCRQRSQDSHTAPTWQGYPCGRDTASKHAEATFSGHLSLLRPPRADGVGGRHLLVLSATSYVLRGRLPAVPLSLSSGMQVLGHRPDSWTDLRDAPKAGAEVPSPVPQPPGLQPARGALRKDGDGPRAHLAPPGWTPTLFSVCIKSLCRLPRVSPGVALPPYLPGLKTSVRGTARSVCSPRGAGGRAGPLPSPPLLSHSLTSGFAFLFGLRG